MISRNETESPVTNDDMDAVGKEQGIEDRKRKEPNPKRNQLFAKLGSSLELFLRCAAFHSTLMVKPGAVSTLSSSTNFLNLTPLHA